MVSIPPAATSSAIVKPTTTPVDRAVRRDLAIRTAIIICHREGHHDTCAAAFVTRYAGLPAELHGEPTNEREAEAATHVGSDRAVARVEAVVLDHELHFLIALLQGLDANLGRGHPAEIVAEGAADRLGDDQADRNGSVRANRHDRRADVISHRRTLYAGPRDGDLAHQIADELLEVHQRPARSLIEMAMQDRQGENPVLRVAEEATDAWRANLARRQIEQARDHLQVVLHAMMNFPQHVIALLESRPQVAFAAGNRFRHLPDALADHRQLLCPGKARGKTDILSPRNATREVADVSQRPHAPAIRPEPRREQDQQR